jgi:hypothetical protein
LEEDLSIVKEILQNEGGFWLNTSYCSIQD